MEHRKEFRANRTTGYGVGVYSRLVKICEDTGQSWNDVVNEVTLLGLDAYDAKLGTNNEHK